MNNKDMLKKLYPKSKIFTLDIEGEKIQFEFFPLPIDDLQMFSSLNEESNMQQQSEMMRKILARSLRVDEEDVKNINVSYLEDIMKCIEDVNNFDKMSKRKDVQELMKKKGLKLAKKIDRGTTTES